MSASESEVGMLEGGAYDMFAPGSGLGSKDSNHSSLRSSTLYDPATRSIRFEGGRQPDDVGQPIHRDRLQLRTSGRCDLILRLIRFCFGNLFVCYPAEADDIEGAGEHVSEECGRR